MSKRDRLIVERFGECWHNIRDLAYEGGTTKFCVKCDKEVACNIDLSTPEGFFWLWGKMRGDCELWERFVHKFLPTFSGYPRWYQLMKLIDNPSTFAEVVYEFLKG